MIHPLAFLGAVGISFSAIFVRLAGVSPDTAAFFRVAYALPALVLVWLARRGRDRRTWRDRRLAFLAGLFFAADLAFWHRSIGDIGAGLATVLGNVQVAFVGLAAWAVHRERPTRAAFLLVPVVFVGVVLISGLGGEDAFGADPVAGVIFGILTAMAYAGFLLILRASNRGLAPPAGPLMDATAGAVVGTLALGMLFDDRFSFSVGWPAWGWLIALALVAQVVGWLLISHALPRLAALETSVMLLVQPMATVLWGFLIFEELLSVVQWGGVALVLGGIAALSALGSVEGAREQRAAARQAALQR